MISNAYKAMIVPLFYIDKRRFYIFSMDIT